jgi:membrane protein
MIRPDGATDPSSAPHDKSGSSRVSVRARTGGAPRRLVDAVRVRFEGSAGQIFLGRLGALDFVNSIVLFGASLLLSVLPFIILLSALANHRIDTDLSRHIGLNAQGARIVGELFRSSPAHSAAPIVTALILAAAGTMAVAGSLQVIYERVFGQQHRGWRDILRFVTWAGLLFGVLVTESVISKPVHTAGGPVAQGLVAYAGTAAFFWWTMHFLLAGRVPWRRLMHAALLTALFWIGLELFSSAYFSAAIISDSRLYGTIGVVFSLLTWFIAIGAVIMLGAVAGTTWDQRKDRCGGTTTGSSGRGHDRSRRPAPATRELTP